MMYKTNEICLCCISILFQIKLFIKQEIHILTLCANEVILCNDIMALSGRAQMVIHDGIFEHRTDGKRSPKTRQLFTLTCGRRLEYLDRTQEDMERTCKLITEKPLAPKGFESGTFCHNFGIRQYIPICLWSH